MCVSKSASNAGLFVPFGSDQRVEKKRRRRKRKLAFETKMERIEEEGFSYIFHGMERNLNSFKFKFNLNVSQFFLQIQTVNENYTFIYLYNFYSKNYINIITQLDQRIINVKINFNTILQSFADQCIAK